MSTAASNSRDDSEIVPVYLVFGSELILDAPVEKVWRCLLDYASWQNYPVRQHVSGEPGREGEVVLLKKEEQGYSSPPYYARTIKIEPGRRIIWKTYREKAAGDEGYFGFIHFSLHEAGSGTRFSSTNIYEYLVSCEDESEAERFRKERYEQFAGVFAATHAKLKKLAEGA